MIRQETVAALSAHFVQAIRDHYLAAQADGIPGPDRVHEVLNALAIAAAIVLAGTDYDPRAIAFFLDALEKQLADLRDSAPARAS